MALRNASTVQPPTSDDPFKYVGGDPALDFVNTVDSTSRGPERDRLTSYDRLVEWAIDAGVVSRELGAALRAASRRSPKRRDAALDSAVRLRAVLRRVLRAIATGQSDDAALTDFDPYVERALAQRTIVRENARRGSRATIRLDWAWRDADSLDAIEWAIVWSAASLIVSDDAGRLRVCGGDDCGWMFVDRSRNGLRRWCEMDVCGMKEKNRRRGARAARATRSPSPSRSRTV
jgi:predicted RNA-binding Zn ribbon-like protein